MLLILGLALVAAIINVISIKPDDHSYLKRVSLQWSFLILIISTLIWFSLNINLGFQFNSCLCLSFYWTLIPFGVDSISLFFIFLSTLLIPICILTSWNSIKFLVKEYLLCLLIIELLLIGVFTALDIIIFYILFEAILIPMFIIIGVWGAREQKIKAAYYFFFYTLFGSVFMLLAIFKLYSITGTTHFQVLLALDIPKNSQFWIFLGFFLSFAVKVPKLPFHIWLPQAHVEAPVAGSVLLAGILLKLGGYGFLRFSFPLLPEASQFFAPFIITLSLLAVIYGSLTTCRQTDMKRLIAYSSVAHMGLVTLAIFSGNLEGLTASIFLMVAHGLVSSALFILVTVPYDRVGTRLIRYYRGLAISMPLFASLFILFTLANIALPMSCNFIGEFYALIAAFKFNKLAGILASVGIVLSAAYSLLLYNRISFGAPSNFTHLTRDLSRRETNVLITLVLPTYILGIFPSLLITYTTPELLLTYAN